MSESGDTSQDRFVALIEALEGVGDSADLLRLKGAGSELFGAEMLVELREMGAVPGLGKATAPFLGLIEDLEADPDGAWERYKEAIAQRGKAEAALADLYRRVEALAEQADYDAAIELAESTLRFTDQEGHWVWSAEFHMALATCFRQRRVDVRLDIDEAINHMELAARGAPLPVMRAEREMNLAALYGMRRNGDPEENLEMALGILRDALGRLGPDAPTELRARVMSNLARGLQTRERGDGIANLKRSLEIGREAAELTSLRNDPEGWALVRINLAESIRSLAREGEADEAEAENILEEVSGADEIREIKSFVGVASSALGEIHLARATTMAEESGRIGLGGGADSIGSPDDTEATELASAELYLRRATETIDPASHGWQLGRSLDQLAQTYVLSGEAEQAIDTFREALSVEEANVAPALILGTGFGLGGALARKGDWPGAAEAYSKAQEAARTSLVGRLGNQGRRAEMRRAGNIARWAAFALGRTGELEAAVIAIETGRAQDVRRRLGSDVDEAALARLPEGARQAYLAAVEALVSAPAGEASDQAAREFQEVIASIRSRDGLGDFADGVSLSMVGDATEPGWPIVYVDPTPWGVMVLSVSRVGGDIRTDASFSDAISGEAVVLDLMLGDRSKSQPRLSYLAMCAGGEGSIRSRKGAVEEAVSAVGQIGALICSHLEKIEAEGATLVSCGPVSEAPVHAASWVEGDSSFSLIDRYPVRFGPSAGLQATCVERARSREDAERILLALGNPDLGDPEMDLEAAEAEVVALGDRYPGDRRRVAVRGDASADCFVENVSRATEIHLACHAEGGLFGYEEAELKLAGRSIKGAELERLPIASRVAVLSACQTGLTDMANLPDEAASMGTALLVAGSSAVVATLWPVADESTALLMSYFYDGLLDEGLPAARALRDAQLALRDAEDGRFAHPFFWAGVILLGA